MTALLVRRLRLDLRSPGGHFIRAFAALCVLFTIFAVMQSPMMFGAPGRMVYGWIVWIDSLLISVGSVTIFASIIAAEREQGTLPLLRLTDTPPLSLLLGQGFSGVAVGCLLLLVQFPFVMLTITLGGVVWDQVAATFMALLAHLVLCAGLGLFWSVICSRSGTASFYTLVSMFSLWLGTWLFRQVLSALAVRGWIQQHTQTMLDEASVWLDQRLIWSELNSIASSFGILPLVSPQFWWSLGGGIALLIAGALLLDHRPLETPPYSPIVIRLWRTSGNRAWRNLAVAGKDYRQFMGGMKGCIARFVVYLLVPLLATWVFVMFTTTVFHEDDVWTTLFWFGFAFLTVEGAAIASRLFRNELVELTWSSLMVLPRWRPQVVVEKLMAAWLGLLPGVFVLLVSGYFSTTVRDFFFASGFTRQQQWFAMMLAMQPILWIAVTSLASMVLVGVPPTVTVFCGFLAIIFQYFFMLLMSFMLFSSGLSFEQFATTYLISTAILVVACELFAMLRLRKLTSRA
ncbi:hypothetical protein AYO47_05445 [Planctomyces sp. SCGC AG-212-M04]|nr:hypothetical protein AYO47_05445 [Planctomyces sp. SCGC AG-212-M04]